MPGPAKARPLIIYLAAAAAALLFPCIVMIAILTNRYAESEQARLETTAQSALQYITGALEREIAGQVAMLQALATSPYLRSKDYESFDLQCRELGASLGINFILRDANGRQLLNTRLPWGSALPMGASQAAIEQAQSKLAAAFTAQESKVHVSDLYFGPNSQTYLVAVEVPVKDGSGSSSILEEIVPPSLFAGLLKREAPPAPYFVSIADRKGEIIARSTRSEEFLGTKLPAFEAATGPSGAVRALRNPQGEEVVGFYRHSTSSGWLVTIGINKAAFEAPLNQSLRFIALIGGALLLLGIAVAWAIARFVTKAIRSLGVIAEQLSGRGKVVPPPTQILEAQTIGNALALASTQLHQQADELERSAKELEDRIKKRTRDLDETKKFLDSIVENIPISVVVKDAETRKLILVNQAFENLLALSRADLLGKDVFDLYKREHAELMDAADTQCASGDSSVNFLEYDVDTPVHGLRSVAARRFVIRDKAGKAKYLVVVIDDVTERKKTEQRIRFMAHHDALTGLDNRLTVVQKIEEAADRQHRSGEPFSVLILDLDRFKQVNDTLGHPAGDALLRDVAARLKPLLRDVDVFARLGGDEFAIVQIGASSPREAAGALAERIIELVAQPFNIEGNEINVATSIGIAMAPEHATDSDNLLKMADLALYRAKSGGRSGYCFFDREMGAAVVARHDLEGNLRRAIQNDEFTLYYQPIVDMKTRRICCAEALIRWRHPSKGLVLPDQFIPLAEETGLITQIGEWVLHTACKDAVGFPADIKVAVNLSAVQFRKSNLPDVVMYALAESGLAPERLDLEITETALIESAAQCMPALRRFKNLGISVALDDFGTGYSSLRQITMFPFDKIKIDKSFTQNMTKRADSAAIIAATMTLALSLDIETTAEGVETLEQYRLLRLAGVGSLQGYLFESPSPLAEIDFGRVYAAAEMEDAA